MEDAFVGIDVGASRLHCVAIDEEARVARTALVASDGLDELARWTRRTSVIAIDAPAAISTAPHAEDASLSAKFRPARCAEIALGRVHGAWVPWVSPTGPPLPGWVETGLALYEALSGCGAELIEVYPHAGFRELAGGTRLPKKQTAAGARDRARLLRSAGVAGEQLESWSHDSLDACVAALVALHRGRGIARSVGCGHDGSAIWLPAT